MSTQRVTGLSSGFDTQSIVDSLMAIEKVPYEKLDVKKQTEQLKLQAYQAVNTYLMKFRSSISGLSSSKLWNSKATVSSNEKSLTATANQYAVNGSYSFKVAQLATAAQYMSKGFSSSKSPIVAQKEGEAPYKVGEINLASAKTRVDNSAKLDTLNGGKGIYRGSIRITDRNNNSSIVDLSSCDTVDDVVRTINESSTAHVTASIKDGRLHIQDESGGTGTLKIQNVGTGTTANDLGIAGAADIATPTVLHGRNVYTLGSDMSLDLVNDGLGVEEGRIGLRVYDQNSYVELAVDVNDCKTVGDIVKRVNAEIERLRTDGFTAEEIASGMNPGGGDPAALLANLRFGVSSDGQSFSFTGVQDHHSYEFLDFDDGTVFKSTPAQQLGLTTGTQTAQAGQKEIVFDRILGSVDSPMLKNLGGVTGDGVGSSSSSSSNKVPVPFDMNTKVSSLNQGKGIDASMPMQFILLEGGKSSDGVDISDASNMRMLTDVIDMGDLQTFLANPNATIGQLVGFLNGQVSAYADNPANNAAGLKGMYFAVDEYNNRLVVAGAQAGYSIQIAGSLAGSLGLTRVRDSSGGSHTALETDNAAQRDAVDDFYGMGTYNTSLKDPLDNDPLSLGDPNASPPEAGSTLDKLAALFPGVVKGTPVDPTDPIEVAAIEAQYKTDINAELTRLFGTDEGFTISTGNAFDGSGNPVHNTYDSGGNIISTSPATSVTVKWSDLKQADGVTPLTIDADTDLGDLVRSVNTAVADAFAGEGYTGHVPEMRLNSLGNGLQWSNMDFTQAWSFESYSGPSSTNSGTKALDLMQMSKDTTAIMANPQQVASAIQYDLDPRETGYYSVTPVDASNANSIKISTLNYGVGITFGGEDTDTIDIEFGAGKSISITMAELRSAVANLATTNHAGDLSAITLDEYVATLNGLVDDKIDDYYTTNEPGVPAADRFTMQFKVGDGKMLVDGIDNATSLKISGNSVDQYGTRTGLAPVDIPDLSAIGATQEISAGNLVSADFYAQEVEGLGEIAFTLDNGTEMRLKTDGITQNSTLSDLIEKLNSQLDELAVSKSEPDLAKIRFTINDAGTGIAVENSSASRITFVDTTEMKNGVPHSDAQYLAQDLGLVTANDKPVTVEAYSFHNSSSLGRKYISRASGLEEFIGTSGEKGTIQVTNALGKTLNIGLENCETIGDVIDAINAEPGFGVRAQINARGDGIDIIEEYPAGYAPDPGLVTHNIGIQDVDGGTIAKKLGIAGTGNRDNPEYMGYSIFEGSLTKSIDVMSTDTLESVMYRISEAGYKTAVVNDGSSTNPYRLTISASSTGEANDFVIDCDIEEFGFTQTARGRDAKVLYGDPNSASSPVMLSSATNSNSNAILGLTLDLKQASADWTTITVDTDKEAVVEEIKAMVESYNELAGIISYLDAYDEETGEPGILFGDTSVRNLLDGINEYFYAIFNPNNKQLGSVDSNGVQNTWTWMDMGISLSAKNSNTDGSGSWYTTMELDLDVLDDMVASNWDALSAMLSNQRNATNSTMDSDAKPTSYFNGELEDGYSVENAMNGDVNKASWGAANGIQAAGTIADGNNEYTIWFQNATTMTRMSIYHYSADTALKDFTIEYLDATTGKWEVFREIEGNASDATHLGTALPVTMNAIRIRADSTNATDDKFRLLDVQVFEEIGLAGQLNQLTTTLGDTQLGFLAERNTAVQASITDIDEQMARLQERLDAKEESLWRRFTAMETALGQMQNQSSYFTSMISSLTGSSK